MLTGKFPALTHDLHQALVVHDDLVRHASLAPKAQHGTTAAHEAHVAIL